MKTPYDRYNPGTQREKCYHSHPPLIVGGFAIYGGSCISPAVEDADVYVGFDHGMAFTRSRFPWVPGDSFLFPIPNMGVPPSPVDTSDLVDWLWGEMQSGKRVHIGCIGGHGRTGVILSALVKRYGGIGDDSTAYVRSNYCKKAVESQEQVDWLHKHFGVSKSAVRIKSLPTKTTQGGRFIYPPREPKSEHEDYSVFLGVESTWADLSPGLPSTFHPDSGRIPIFDN